MIRCYLLRNNDLSFLERRFISELFYKIAKVLEIRNEDVVCGIDFYVRRSPAEPAGTFSMTEANPYKIKLANLFVEPAVLQSPCKQMGRSLAHEMIHLKQRLRDGLAVTLDSTSTTLTTRRFLFKGQVYNSADVSPDSPQKHLPFEEEAHSLMGKVFRQALEAKCQTALTNSADTPDNYAEATVIIMHAETLGRIGFRAALTRYRESRAAGDKEHRRQTDKEAGSISPQKLFGVPVGLMFFEGAPRLLASGHHPAPQSG